MKNKLMTLAHLLEYPTSVAAGGDAAPTALDGLTQEEREELYTATFDVTPSCVPYVSIHLFGEENFKRGEFMAALHARYAQAGFDTRGELADHIAVLLRFAAHVDESERREMAEFCLMRPLEKMMAALPVTNPYRRVLEEARGLFDGLAAVPLPVEQMQMHGASCAGCGVTTHD
jgi:nitrate reductase assembly molybdenum cofactor insertion protein NarJ